MQRNLTISGSSLESEPTTSERGQEVSNSWTEPCGKVVLVVLVPVVAVVELLAVAVLPWFSRGHAWL